MIFDLLSHQALYRQIHPAFAAGFDWLLKFDPAMADAKIPLDGDRVFALVQSYTTGPAADKRLESHVNYIDIQYIAAGRERMQVASRGDLTVTMPYDASRDVAFYADPEEITSLECTPGTFAIYFPHDAHKPGTIAVTAQPVKKVVLKIRV